MAKGICSDPGCGLPHYARGWCQPRYQRERRKGLAPLPRPTLAERFWAKVDRTGDGCHPFTGSTDPKGYGRIHFKGSGRLAHRMAWTLTYGPIPKGMQVCHRCDNPPCCRPDHLFLGTNADNRQDFRAKRRAAATCRRGHPWTPENTYTRGAHRHCRTCARERDERRRAEWRAMQNAG